MTLPFLIHDEADYERALALIGELWGAEPGTNEARVLEVQAHLVDEYERATSTLEPADPIKLIEFKLAELRWSQRELGRRLGWTSGRVSEVLSGKRSLTLQMVRELSSVLKLSAGLLVHDTRRDTEGVPLPLRQGPPSLTTLNAPVLIDEVTWTGSAGQPVRRCA